MQLASRFASRSPALRSDYPLTDDQIRRVAPSIFAEAPHESSSQRYAHIPTAAVLAELRKEGFQPFMACQTRVRDEGKREHTKHMLRLRHASQINGAEANEIILLNSHDGTSSYQMLAGMFRSCAMRAITLDEGEAEVFARAALDLKYDATDNKLAPIAESQILMPRRFDDRRPDYADLEDDVDWHWKRIVAGAVLTTLLGVGAELAAPENRQDGNRIVIAGRDSAQDSINQIGQEITRRDMNILPTLTERPGLPVRIIVNRDLVLRPYQPLFFNRGASQ